MLDPGPFHMLGTPVWSKSSNGSPDKFLINIYIYPMDGGAWWATVHGIAKSQTQLSDFTFTFYYIYIIYKLHFKYQITFPCCFSLLIFIFD